MYKWLMMNKETEESIESTRYNYAALKQLHRIANNENDRLNDDNNALKQEVKTLKEIINAQTKQLTVFQQMVTEAYTTSNTIKTQYINQIQLLQSELDRLKNND